eukprot:TRINITY_DN135_c1_g1_i1.p1 TRINITY_DN135_c1_g1~~TRINITY_DN135_c1_g1_i1.p1  ORF type:complete len:757 (+),score=267.36 TRINITY_DN135_c1_g1_i1:460-2730(+)
MIVEDAENEDTSFLKNDEELAIYTNNEKGGLMELCGPNTTKCYPAEKMFSSKIINFDNPCFFNGGLKNFKAINLTRGINVPLKVIGLPVIQKFNLNATLKNFDIQKDEIGAYKEILLLDPKLCGELIEENVEVEITCGPVKKPFKVDLCGPNSETKCTKAIDVEVPPCCVGYNDPVFFDIKGGDAFNNDELVINSAIIKAQVVNLSGVDEKMSVIAGEKISFGLTGVHLPLTKVYVKLCNIEQPTKNRSLTRFLWEDLSTLGDCPYTIPVCDKGECITNEQFYAQIPCEAGYMKAAIVYNTVYNCRESLAYMELIDILPKVITARLTTEKELLCPGERVNVILNSKCPVSGPIKCPEDRFVPSPYEECPTACETDTDCDVKMGEICCDKCAFCDASPTPPPGITTEPQIPGDCETEECKEKLLKKLMDEKKESLELEDKKDHLNILDFVFGRRLSEDNGGDKCAEKICRPGVCDIDHPANAAVFGYCGDYTFPICNPNAQLGVIPCLVGVPLSFEVPHQCEGSHLRLMVQPVTKKSIEPYLVPGRVVGSWDEEHKCYVDYEIVDKQPYDSCNLRLPVPGVLTCDDFLAKSGYSTGPVFAGGKCENYFFDLDVKNKYPSCLYDDVNLYCEESAAMINSRMKCGGHIVSTGDVVADLIHHDLLHPFSQSANVGSMIDELKDTWKSLFGLTAYSVACKDTPHVLTFKAHLPKYNVFHVDIDLLTSVEEFHLEVPNDHPVELIIINVRAPHGEPDDKHIF